MYNLLGAIVLGFVSYSTMSANVPTIYSPFSLTVVLPTFYIYDLGKILPSFLSFLPVILARCIVPLFFIAWSHKLYSNTCKIPRRSIILFSMMIILSFISLFGSWNYGIEYQGKFHTIAMYGLNLIFWVVMIFLYLLNRKKPSFKISFIFHWISFAWLAWVAFPWLGELL